MRQLRRHLVQAVLRAGQLRPLRCLRQRLRVGDCEELSRPHALTANLLMSSFQFNKWQFLICLAIREFIRGDLQQKVAFKGKLTVK